jgi:zinc protease
VVLVEQPVSTISGVLEWQGPSTVGKDVDLTYAADILSYVTAEAPSHFQKDLVDSGACVNASLSWFTQMNVGPISVNFEAAPEKADACVSAILAELPRLKSPDYESDTELQSAAYRAEVDQARERETPSGLAHSLSFWWSSAGLDYYLHYVENMKQVKREQIARYVDSYIVGKPFVMGVMVSPEMKRDRGLDQAHFERLAALKTPVVGGPLR